MLTKRWSLVMTRLFSCFLFSATCAAILSGCASMASSNEELQNVAENEGVVFGSLVINVERGPEKESGWAFLQGQKAGEATYAIAISERGFNPLKQTYVFRATPGKEEAFIKKLPAGDYQIQKIKKEGFSSLELNLRVNFTVAPRQTAYIGKLTVQFPDRITMGSPVRMNVADAQLETTELLKKEHKNSLANAVKALMAIQ